jgi:cobalt/nickel transport system permease protein
MHKIFEIEHATTESRGGLANVIHPSVWLIIVVVFVISVVTTSELQLPKFFLYFLFIVVYASCLSLSFSFVLKATLASFPMIIFILLMFSPYLFNFSCFFSSFSFYQCLNFKVFMRVVNVILKVILCMTITIIFTKALKKSQILKALAGISLPTILVKIMSVVLLYFEVLISLLSRMRQALKLRLFRKVSVTSYWKLLAFIIAKLFVRSYYKVEVVHWSLKLRGYGKKVKESILSFALPDLAFLLVFIAIIFALKIVSFVYL